MLVENQYQIVNGLVSVIIPIYGSFDIRRAVLAIASIKNQKDVDIEIVVSEQGEFPRIGNVLPIDVKYVFNKHVQSRELSNFNPGLIRNIAIAKSSGEFVYTNDADILFCNTRFIANSIALLKKHKKLVLHRPQMRRVPLDNFDLFLRYYSERGIIKALSYLDKSQDFLATIDSKYRTLKVVKKQGDYYEKTFTTAIEDFDKYLSDPFLIGREPMIWSEDLHCGGNLFRKEHFYQVGRYCENFVNWGCEDSDLQWKMTAYYDLQFFPKTEKFEVLHLDHSKDYFSSSMWNLNEEICAKRKTAGVDCAIKKDREKQSQ